MRRFSARPNMWWSLANEYDLMAAREPEDWYVFEEYIAANDVYGHLMSNHNCTVMYDHHRELITHVCVQTDWVQKCADWQKE